MDPTVKCANLNPNCPGCIAAGQLIAGYEDTIAQAKRKIREQQRTLPPAVQEVVDAVKELDLHLLPKRKPENYMHCFRPCDKINRVVQALAKLDQGGA